MIDRNGSPLRNPAFRRVWIGATVSAADRTLQAAARTHGLPDDVTGLTRRAERWRPWRGYAAHPLWRTAAGTTIGGRDHH